MADRPSAGVSLPGLAALLTAVFTALRLARVMSWSWWWVLSPLWAMVALLLLIFAGILVTAGIDRRARQKNRAGAPAGSWLLRGYVRPATTKSPATTRSLPPQLGT
jgi:hypothetical protein